MNDSIKIAQYDYPLPEERIAKYPLAERNSSKLLKYQVGSIEEHKFTELPDLLPSETLLIFNNTKVIRSRIIMQKPTGARIEVFCLEPHTPADYERSLASIGCCSWSCIVGNSKKWKEGYVEIKFEWDKEATSLRAYREINSPEQQVIRFEWDCPLSFGQLLEHLGRVPIPPYLNRESEESDNTRYQTVYSKYEGSVAAPTAGLHFTEEQICLMQNRGFQFDGVTLHVGAGTFLPVKCDCAVDHHMHTEHFEITAETLKNIIANLGNITAVGTTSVRTLESIAALGERIIKHSDPMCQQTIGQWEVYDIPQTTPTLELLSKVLDYMYEYNLDKISAATCIMIMPGFRFRVVSNLITNFHQPKSTLLLLVSALVGEDWRKIYNFALDNDFRFLSYGDSNLLFGQGIL